ncbi:MAG: hypothetical protein KF734_06390 [Saprospiraceae bacterium]|nr:hypothetical protein [Saprospiraceae bacterium]
MPVPANASTGTFNFIVMRTKYFSHILALSVIVAACCKSDDPVMEANCLEQASFPSESVDDTAYNCCPDCLLDPEELYFAGQPYDYAEPCFNPNNSSQIAYYRYNTSTVEAGWEIWVQDLCTGEKRMLVNDANYGIDWSVKDWIVYTATDQQIYMIKSNGDSLTKLTFFGDYNRRPKWDAKGDRIAYVCQAGSAGHFIILNTSTGLRDTISELWTAGAWNWISENEVSYANATGGGGITTQYLRKIDLSSRQSTLLHTLNIVGNNDSLLLSTDYSSSVNSIIWCAYGTIGRTNINTGAFEVIKDAYRQESFYNAVVSKDEKHILFDIRSRKLLGPCTYDSDYGLYIMDLNGKNQRRVKIE